MKVFNTIEDLICNITQHAKIAEGKEIILVLGNTGAGKSTLINYLMGIPLKKFTYRSQRRFKVNVDVIDQKNTGPEIGHEKKSKTFYAKVYKTDKTYGNKEIYLCDTAGFDDNREPIEKIGSTINTELAIKNAKKIKGIIVVIAHSELIGNRGAAFSRLHKTLAQLIEKPDEISSSIMFVINQMPGDIYSDGKKGVIEHLQQDLEEVKKEKESKITTYMREMGNKFASFFHLAKKEKITMKELDSSQQILELMLKCQNNIVLVDQNLHKPENDAVKKIYNMINKFQKSIPKNKFIFDEDDNRKDFNKVVYDTCYVGGMFIKNKFDLMNSIEEMKTDLKGNEENIVYYKKLIDNKKSIDNKKLDNVNSTKNFKEFANKHKNSLVEKQKTIEKKLTELRQGKEKLEKEDKDINKQTKEEFWRSYPVDEKRSWLGKKLWGWTEATFTCPYDIPFQTEDIIEFCKNGKFYDKKIDGSKGEYKSTYKSGYGKNGKAQVVIRAEMRNIHAKRIKQIENELKKVKEDIKNRKEEWYFNHCTLEGAEMFSKDKQKEQVSSEDELSQLESTYRTLMDKKKKLQNDLVKNKEKLKNIDEKLKEDHKLYGSIYNIVVTLELFKGINSGIVQIFMKRFKKYKNKKHTPKFSFSDTPIDHFNCPITDELMVDPVILPESGQTYERKAILKWLEDNDTDPKTRQKVNNKSPGLIKNIALKNAIDEYKKLQKTKFTGDISSFNSFGNEKFLKSDPEKLKKEITKTKNTINKIEFKLESANRWLSKLLKMQNEIGSKDEKKNTGKFFSIRKENIPTIIEEEDEGEEEMCDKKSSPSTSPN